MNVYKRQWFICYPDNAYYNNTVDFFNNLLSGYMLDICYVMGGFLGI